jgi:predicted transcriptional regulator
MKNPEPPKLVQPNPIKINETKWSKVLMDAGWTVVPNVLLVRQRALGLDATDINILLHLMQHWWRKDDKPHPSKKTIATAMNIHPRTVQRRIARLEKAGLIARQVRRVDGRASLTNIYHLDGLITAVKPYAQEMIEGVKKKVEEKAALRAKKGKPHLKVIDKDEDE